MSVTRIETPCIGICSTIYGDMVCRGCKRFYDEIIDWNGYSDTQKQLILERLNTLYDDTVSRFLEVVDAKLLRLKCQRFHVKIRLEFTPYTWAYQLLREGANRIKDLSKYGIEPKQEFGTLQQLYCEIDDALFAQATAQQSIASSTI